MLSKETGFKDHHSEDGAAGKQWPKPAGKGHRGAGRAKQQWGWGPDGTEGHDWTCGVGVCE